MTSGGPQTLGTQHVPVGTDLPQLPRPHCYGSPASLFQEIAPLPAKGSRQALKWLPRLPIPNPQAPRNSKACPHCLHNPLALCLLSSASLHPRTQAFCPGLLKPPSWASGFQTTFSSPSFNRGSLFLTCQPDVVNPVLKIHLGSSSPLG